jgi:hypothetical protein
VERMRAIDIDIDADAGLDHKDVNVAVADDDENIVTLLFHNGEEIQIAACILRQHSAYFCALLDSGLAESRSRRIELLHLDPRAVRAILFSLDIETTEKMTLWEGFDWANQEHVASLVQVVDYLQITGTHDRGGDGGDGIMDGGGEYCIDLQVIRILNCPDMIRSECAAVGLVDPETWGIHKIPVGKKKKFWRFWVCFLLCLEIMPDEGVLMEQSTFTERLGPVGESCGGAVALRRDLIEYGLIEREGDGSAYWRPVYTATMLRRWIKGKGIERKVI